MWTRRPCRKASPAGRAGRGRARGGRPGGTVPMCHEVSCFVMRGPCDVMRCHEVRRAAPRSASPAPARPTALRDAGKEGRCRCVMKCHEMSCFVMRPAAPLSASLAEAPLSLSCMSSLHRISFRSRRRRFPGKRPCFARIACAPAPAFAPARFARLIARAGKRKAHVSRPFRWVFFAPARGRRRNGPRMPLPPVPSYHGFTGHKPFRELFHNL